MTEVFNSQSDAIIAVTKQSDEIHCEKSNEEIEILFSNNQSDLLFGSCLENKHQQDESSTTLALTE